MKAQTSLRSASVVVLLLTAIVLTAISASLFIRIDGIVHGKLYDYGLQFDPAWATKYWNNSRPMLAFFEVTMITIGVAIALVQFGAQTNKARSTRLVSCGLLIVGIVSVGLSAILFNQIDAIVNTDLYRYGLQFSYEWAEEYWTYARLMLSCIGAAAAVTLVSVALISIHAGPQQQSMVQARALPRRRATVQLTSARVGGLFLFISGFLALALAVIYESSILVFIGLGLVFWAAILLYIRPEKYVKEVLLGRSAMSAIQGLDKMLLELGYKGKAVYLPPSYLKDFESSRAYIGAGERAELPSPEDMHVREEKGLSKNPDGILLMPPGADLAMLFEETLGTSFTRVDSAYLEQKLPDLLIEELETTQSFEMETNENVVRVRIENSIYKDTCLETAKLSNAGSSLGCPLCSAIACALAKATGKPVIIENEKRSSNGEHIDIEYRLL